MSGGCGLGMVFGRPADPDKHWPHARFEQISTWQKRDSLRNPLQCGEFQQVLRGLLDLAGKVLPVYLKPGGANPLVPLHKLASEGVHNLPEDECIQIFDESIVVFSFVFSELRRHQAQVKTFAKSLDKLVKK